MAVGAEQLGLGLLREERADLEGVRRAQAQVPADAGVGAGDLDDHAIEGVQTELVATEPARLQDPMEAGRDELLVKLGGVGAALLGVGGLGQYPLAQRAGARDDLIRGQLRLGRRRSAWRWPRLRRQAGHDHAAQVTLLGGRVERVVDPVERVARGDDRLGVEPAVLHHPDEPRQVVAHADVAVLGAEDRAALHRRSPAAGR